MIIPMFEGDICTLNITQGSKFIVDQIMLKNVLFGDVFICSGESLTFVSLNFRKTEFKPQS